MPVSKHYRIRDNVGFYRRRRGPAGAAKEYTFSLDKKTKTAVYLRDDVEMHSDTKVLTPRFLSDIKFYLQLEKLPVLKDLLTMLEDHCFAAKVENTKDNIKVTVNPLAVSELYFSMMNKHAHGFERVFAKIEDASTEELLESHASFGTVFELAHAMFNEDEAEEVRLYVLGRLGPLYTVKRHGPAELVKRMIEFKETRVDSTLGRTEVKVTLNGQQAYHSVSNEREPGDAISSVIHLVTGENGMLAHLAHPHASSPSLPELYTIVTSSASSRTEPIVLMSYVEWPAVKTLLSLTSPAPAIDDLLLDNAALITEDHIRTTAEPTLWYIAQTKADGGDEAWTAVRDTLRSFGANVTW